MPIKKKKDIAAEFGIPRSILSRIKRPCRKIMMLKAQQGCDTRDPMRNVWTQPCFNGLPQLKHYLPVGKC